MNGSPQPIPDCRIHTRSRARLAPRCLITITVFITIAGCSRATYRNWADHEVDGILAGQQDDSRWLLPYRSVEAHPHSRMFDPNHPDCGDRPADDPAAHTRLVWPNGIDNHRYWDKIPQCAVIDDEAWMSFLPRGEDGTVSISRETAIDLALLHNRNYQSRVEGIYLSALGLSADRFEFMTQWFGGAGSSYNRSGDFSSLSANTRLGLTRNLAAGGQFAASLLNSFTWQLTPNSSNFSAGNIVLSFTQPLLRGAFRHVRLESLAQNERSLLYNIRDFARFRRQFYLDITSSYLAILAQLQGLRNQQLNLESLELNLRETQARFEMQMVSQLSVDQVFQEYQQSRIGILAGEQNYQDSLDGFKFTLGLPSHIPISIDESLLKPFELNDPRLDEYQQRADSLMLELSQTLPPEEPTPELLQETMGGLSELQDALIEIIPEVQSEFEQWEALLQLGLRENALPEEEIDFQQQQELILRVKEQLDTAISELQQDIADRDTWRSTVEAEDPIEAWRSVSRALGRRFREQLSTIFIAQTQIRLFLITVTPFDIEEQEAIEYAIAERLDLMNQRARVNDAFRNVEIAADRLQSDLDVSARANIGTDASINNGFRFDSDASSYNVGVDFDGPLNRLSERNGYRSAQIGYQQSRREFMAQQDGIVNQIRSDLRNLKISWLNFQISRQTLISATRQVEVAQFNLRSAAEATDTNLTRDLLDALQGLLGARNGLISSWISYEISRITLFVDLELLYLDDSGKWINEAAQNIQGAQDQSSFQPSAEQGDDPTPEAMTNVIDWDTTHVETINRNRKPVGSRGHTTSAGSDSNDTGSSRRSHSGSRTDIQPPRVIQR